VFSPRSQPAMVDSSMPSFCASFSWLSPRVPRTRFSFPFKSSAFWYGIVPKKGENPRKAMYHRLHFVAFPVADRPRVDSELFGRLLLKKAEIQASLPKVIS
jgi:hypothetical protein